MQKALNGFNKWALISVIPFILLFGITSFVYGEWTSVSPPSVSSDWFLTAVHFTSSNEGWAVGDDQGGGTSFGTRGVLLHYSSGTWTSISPPVLSWNWSLEGVHFISSNEGWAVGPDWTNGRGVLLHYSSGTWTSVTPPSMSTPWYLQGVHFTSANEGWAVGTGAVGSDYTNSNAVLLHYSGGTWTFVSPPYTSSSWKLRRIYFSSPSEGWAVGYDYTNSKGVLLHYSGGTWTSVSPPFVSSSWWVSGVHFTSPNEGWVVGCDDIQGSFLSPTVGMGVLLHYSGGNWISVTPPSVSSDWWLRVVHFTSANEGWAVGLDSINKTGVLLHYSGGTWTSVSPPSVSSYWELWGVHFTSAGEGWAVGWDYANKKGVLLRFESAVTSAVNMSITPGSLNFGNVNVGQSINQAITITNEANSTAALTGSVGTLSSPFSVVSGGGAFNLTPGQSVTVMVQFSPTTAGTASAVLSVTHNATNQNNPALVAVSGTGISTNGPVISVTPMSNDYGDVKVKKSRTASFMVTNSGKANLTISASIKGTDASMFRINGAGSKTIKPGKSLTIKVAFKPTSTGSKSATLEITSNDPVTPIVDIPLSGTGQ